MIKSHRTGNPAAQVTHSRNRLSFNVFNLLIKKIISFKKKQQHTITLNQIHLEKLFILVYGIKFTFTEGSKKKNHKTHTRTSAHAKGKVKLMTKHINLTF